MLVRQRPLQMRLDLFDDGGEVAAAVTANPFQVLGFDRPGQHAVPADAAVQVAGIDAQLADAGHLEEAVLALDVLHRFVGPEGLGNLDMAVAQMHPNARVNKFLAGESS